MTTFRKLSTEDADEVNSALSSGGHDFWSLTDSDPSWYGQPRCICGPAAVNPECAIWAHQRDTYCLASKSDSTRCGQRATDTSPFCRFHLKRAWTVLAFAARQEFADRLTSDYQRIEEERKQNHEWAMAKLNMDVALLWDADAAARRLNERVYFFAAGAAVKIGRSVNPEHRVRSLGGTKAPDGVDVRAGQLLGTIPGGCHVESSLHQRFRRHRLVGEWFKLAPIADDVESLIADATEAVA